MSKEIYISSTPHETRLAIVENDALTEIYYERENEYTLAGSIYNGRVTRVLPGMQSSFVDIGLERDAFLYITDFMEEAGDSADFDSGDGKASRGRGDRPRRDAEVSEQPLALAEGAPRAEGDRPERSERDRNDRGRRDRNGRRDRPAPREESGHREDRAPREDQSEQPRAVALSEEAVVNEPREGEEIGEGAPGADGSRRWRGRRGRRRGRGHGEETPQVAASEPVETSVEAAPEPVAEREPRRDGREGRNDRGDRGDRGGRSGGRDQDRGRQDSVRERFAPRETRGGADEEEPLELQAAAEPFLLPGESLSKYRRNADGSPEAPATPASGFATPIAAMKPSTEAPPLVGWDGGLVLPGETLSRRSGGGGGSSEDPREDRGGRGGRGDRGRGDRGNGGRDGRSGRGERERNSSQGSAFGSRAAGSSEPPVSAEAEPTPTSYRSPASSYELHPSEAVQPAVSSHHEPEAFELPVPYEAQTDSPVDTNFVEEAASDAAEETRSIVAEYEPAEDAAVSFRVDPAAPSEFRQSAPVAEEAATEPEETQQAAPEPIAAVPEMTAIQASGEMISEPVVPTEELHIAEQVATPIEHQQAVQSVTLAGAQHEAVQLPQVPQAPQAPQQFAPGDGELEEEMMDEEEGDLPSLQASSVHDDMEEETLEGAADLGVMLREMSIDQITRPMDPADLDDEDDDFLDEEDLEEDAFGDSEEAGEEDADEEADGEEGVEEDEFADAEGGEADNFENAEQREEGEGKAAAERSARPATEGSGGDRKPRREGRDGARRGSRDRGGRDRDRRPSSGGGGSGSGGGRSNDRGGGGGGRSSRMSMQSTNLPAISDLLKPGQELLVQIAKEPIAKKGARITSHIALPGRFLVFMPTVSHVGVSRKIESDGERRRLKEILLSEKGEASGGFIVRTAAANASEEELRSDLRFLLNLWADIKQRSESSKSPALIYHDLNLVERILRDQVTDTFSAIWVDTEDAYERVLRFLQRFQPSLIRRVKLYTKETPLFEQFGITEDINKALRSKVWLKSGGSIVINQTEALVAIDINTGKFVGKTARLEDTIVKTNLDAIPEIVRQIRLRDLGGIIIIDFIDMDERKNRNKVMMALEDELKSDRAPSKVLQFNDFGLVAITRKRVKQSLERTLSSTCGVCQGTGMTKSPVTVCNDIYIEMRKMQKHLDRGDVMLRVNPEVVKQLKAPGTKWLQEMEEMVGKTILVKSDPSIHPESFDIH